MDFLLTFRVNETPTRRRVPLWLTFRLVSLLTRPFEPKPGSHHHGQTSRRPKQCKCGSGEREWRQNTPGLFVKLPLLEAYAKGPGITISAVKYFPTVVQFVFTAIFLGFTASTFGRSNDRTPSLYSALMRSASIASLISKVL